MGKTYKDAVSKKDLKKVMAKDKKDDMKMIKKEMKKGKK